MPLNALQQFGLTEEEAQMYEMLLRLGDVPLADAIRASGAHPQTVYRLVSRLEAKGLVITTTQKHRKYVRAEDPKILEQMERQKLEELRTALPALLALQKAPKEALVRVARGNEAVQSLRLRGIEELRSGETYSIIGGSGDRFYEVMGQRYEEVEKRRIRKKIRRKLLTFESQRKLLRTHERFRAYSTFRFLPQHFPVPASTNIFHDTVAIIIWAKTPIVITIESPEVAASYRHYFTVLWRMAKQ